MKPTENPKRSAVKGDGAVAAVLSLSIARALPTNRQDARVIDRLMNERSKRLSTRPLRRRANG
jgi:hypothetical protein